MKVKETYTGFTGVINPGRFAFFVRLEEDGAYIDYKDICAQAIHFNLVVLVGEPFLQKEEVAKFCKKVLKENNKAHIEIHTSGLYKPRGISSTKVRYIVHTKLKNSGLKYEDRIKESSLNWFNQAEAFFVFKIKTEEDIDDANLIIRTFEITKSNIYFEPLNIDEESIKGVIEYGKYFGYNITSRLDKILWEQYNVRGEHERRSE